LTIGINVGVDSKITDEHGSPPHIRRNRRMRLTVSGKEKEYPDDLTVSRLIELEKVETPIYVTVSINDEFLASGAFARTSLNDGDSVEFLYFMGGGR